MVRKPIRRFLGTTLATDDLLARVDYEILESRFDLIKLVECDSRDARLPRQQAVIHDLLTFNDLECNERCAWQDDVSIQEAYQAGH